MSTLSQIREGLSQAWDTLAEGWHDLRERATHALTRFHPRQQGELHKADEYILQHASRWGLLAAEVSEKARSTITIAPVDQKEQNPAVECPIFE